MQFLTSSGTATPVSIDDEGIIYTATHRFVNRFCYGMDIPDGVGMICMSQVKAETLDDDGHPTSIWGYYRTSNTVANDDNLVMLEENDIDFYNKIFDEYYDNSQPIYFTLASVSLKDYEGLYYKTEMEELEYYDVTHTTGYQFNSDGTGIYYGQDTVDFTWNESEIHFADNTVHFVMESGKLKVGEITYDKMEGRLINPSVFINSVAEGDVIYLKGELVPVNSIQWEDSKCVDINGGSDNDGIDVLEYSSFILKDEISLIEEYLRRTSVSDAQELFRFAH